MTGFAGACRACRTPLPDGAAFCLNCGAPAQAPAGLRTVSGMDTVFGDVPNDLQPGAVFADRYEVIRALGHGGMGVVYLVRDRSARVDVVLKLIHPELAGDETRTRRMIAEGLMAREIRHPNVVSVYDVSVAGNQPYITMEYVAGRTLRAWLEEQWRLDRDVPLAVAVALTKGILAGLAEAHRIGIVHRDLKPENVMLKEGPGDGGMTVKILDFGVAKAMNSAATRVGGRGSSGSGTAVYAAPEQLTSEESARPASDIYSLSVMLHEMLMQAPPQHRWEPISGHRQDVPEALDALIQRGISGRPRTRPQSTAEFEAALDAAIGSAAPPRPTPPLVVDPQVNIPEPPQPIPTPTPAPTPAPDVPAPPAFDFQRWVANNRLAVFGAGGVVLVIVLIAVWPRSSPSPARPLVSSTAPQASGASPYGSTPTPTATPAPPPRTPAPQPPPPAQPAGFWYTSLLGDWSGTYQCQGGYTGINMKFWEVGDNHVDANVQIYTLHVGFTFRDGVMPPRNNMPNASARYHVDRTNSGFTSHFEEWLTPPLSYIVWMPISGYLRDRATIQGGVDACGPLALGRTR